jgi:5-methylcytosine-specific restriction protein A
MLREYPCCEECLKENKIVEATIVDHGEPHKGDPVKFWDRSKWRCVCKKCHDKKTAQEDGGFGNERKSA